MHYRILALLIASATAVVQGAPLTVVNHGFEDITGESPFNEFTFGPLNGWGLYDPNGVTGGGTGGTFYIGTLTPFEPEPISNPGVFANFPDGAAEGQRVGIAFNFQGSDGQGEYGMEQVLGDTLQPHTRYTLEVEIGNITSATAMNGTFFPLEGFPGYRIDLFTEDAFGNRQNLASDNNSLAGSLDDGQWGTSVVSFVTGADHPQLGEDLGIRLVNLNQLDPMFPLSDIEVDFDDVRLDATVLTPGDFDGNENVDGADFLRWQQDLNESFGQTDLVNWINNFGTAPAATLSFAVPEPATILIALTAIGLCATARQF